MSTFNRTSLTLRLTLLFTLISTLVLLTLGGTINSLVEQHFVKLDSELLNGKLSLVRAALAECKSAKELQKLPPRLNDALIGHHGLSVEILEPLSGIVIFAHRPEGLPANIAALPLNKVMKKETTRNGEPIRYLGGQANAAYANSPTLIVALASNLNEHEAFMHSFRITLWVIVLSAALVSGLLGWAAVRRGLAPLNEIRKNTAAITANKLSQRLLTAHMPAELAQVTLTLNEMFARLEDSFQRLSHFSSDIAHELRTPVNNLLTQTQVTLSKNRSIEEYRDVLASNAEEFERLSRTIRDMLFLAKADHGLVIPNPLPVHLHEEVQGVLDFYEPLTDDKKITVTLTGESTVRGDSAMLGRAISNLISNAVRHTPEGGYINVSITSERNRVCLSVINSGQTIAQEHLKKLFDRFYRTDASRQRDSEGSGLGLPITRSIVKMHGGDVSVRSENENTQFDIWLPTHTPD
ncbi:heavy metal sensor histidine kinase [Limnobacter litoralis]|uniref:Sensor protein n=1 Tax=Limnobacter litoralis TaxID=481366 RepID=A0ABQ5YQ77_9BURK|nr:heavy metal sensor histidine kinase [Limnobacter litoralis]GLR25611.1 two-component sensor histidine kinase [Limnobacter litoralis]